MRSFRILLKRNWTFTLALVLFAVALKALVPAGFMIEGTGRSLTILVCADSTGAHSTIKVSVPQPASKSPALAKVHETCAFSSLGFAALAAADPLQLALALAFIVGLGSVASTTFTPRRQPRLLPPPCGPPAGSLS